MLELLFNSIENREEAETVKDFLKQFAANGGDIEESFLAAIHDTKLVGFKEGVRVALALLRETAEIKA